MVKVLIEHNEGLADPKQIQDTADGGWTHAYGEYDALVNYLLLTCFDQLGQSDEWRDYSSWLKARETKLEREEALGSLQARDPISIAGHLHDAYQARYGVRKSFNRFISERITDDARTELLRCVQVQRLDGQAVIDDPKVKQAFLYSTRNAFTHEAKAKGQVARVISPYLTMLGPNGYKYGFTEVDRDRRCTYSVRRWPFILYETVANYIGESVPDFQVTFSVGVDIGGSMIWLEPLLWEHLKHPDELRRLARECAAKSASDST
jgi:hypothetical protein